MSAKRKNTLLTELAHPLSNDEKLAQLGNLNEADIQEAVKQAISAYFSKSGFSAKTKAGTYFYHTLVEALREVLVLKDFSALSHRNIELTYNDKVAIYICKGDEDTASEKMPLSEHPRGAVTLTTLGLSRGVTPPQIDLFESDEFKTPTAYLALTPEGRTLEVYVLLHRLIEQKDNKFNLLLELSRPDSHDNNGRLNSFSNRIIFNFNFDDEPQVSSQEPVFSAPVDIPLNRTTH